MDYNGLKQYLVGAAAMAAFGFVADDLKINTHDIAHPERTYFRTTLVPWCRYVDESQRKDMPRFGWTSMRNFVGMVQAKFGVQPMTQSDADFCNKGLDGMPFKASSS